MKNKKFICLLCTLALTVSMCACSDTKETETQTSNTDVTEESVEESQDESPEEDQAASEDAANEYFTPSEEIINASISSGKIQVGNIVMKQGGYITVGEFITTYGDNLDTSFYEQQVNEYNTWWERNADEDFNHVLQLPIKDTDITIQAAFVSPSSITPDKTTIWDSVIVDFSAYSESGEPCRWYPGGKSAKEFTSLDEAKAWFTENGFTENTDYVYEKNTFMFLDPANPKESLNQFANISIGDTLNYVVAVIEADEVNLFGEKPVMSYSVLDDGSGVFLSYGNRIYLGNQLDWKSSLR